MDNRPVLLYDHACGRCAAFAAVVRLLDPSARVELASLDSARAEELLPDLSRWDRLLELRWLTPDRRQCSGPAAAAALLRYLPATSWIWRLPGAGTAITWGYGLASRTRTCSRESGA